MKNSYNKIYNPKGFSLAEMLAALIIAAMVLAAVLGIYSRAENSANAVTRKLDSDSLPNEIIQQIAEDLDRIIAPNSDTKITVENKFEKGFPTARLTIQKNIYDDKNQEQLFEEIIWQSSYDYDNGDGLALYRSHNGVALEDKLLDGKRKDWEKIYSFVPVCTGITFFKIQVPRGEYFQDAWASPPVPTGIMITISFAKPFETAQGTLDVPEAEKIIRTIAINRARKIGFEIQNPDEQNIKEQEQEGLLEKQQQDRTNEEEQSKTDKPRKDRVEKRNEKQKSNILQKPK
jgi:prepilin-type N-terminal cleavage/methylation domain-containing protein